MNGNGMGMSFENRKLLIQDIMGRLPYDPQFNLNGIAGSIHHINIYSKYSGNEIHDYICEIDFFGDGNCIDIKYFKPILKPLSSMTEEQQKELYSIQGVLTVDFELEEYKMVHLFQSQNVIDRLNKNHFDYRGLIEKGLAIDCTNLNIY